MLTKTLTSTTFEVLKPSNLRSWPSSLTVTLNSTEAGRKIKISTNNGLEFFEPTTNKTTASMLVLSISAPITNLQVIGAVNDTVVVTY